MMADKQEFHVGGTFKGKIWSIRLNVSRENDNVIDQKLYTTVRHRIGMGINIRPMAFWNINLTGNYVNMANDAANDTMLIDNSNIMFGANQMLTLTDRGTLQSITFNYINQTSSDNNPLRSSSRSRSHTMDFRLIIKARANLSLSPSMTFILNRFGGNKWTTTSSYILNCRYRTTAEKITANLSLGPSFSGQSKSFRSAIASIYKITGTDILQSELRYSHFQGADSANDYNEYSANISLSHRF